MNKLLPFMLALGGKLPPRRKDPLENIDINAEYQLIKEKKSNLSANMRRMVVYAWEKTNDNLA